MLARKRNQRLFTQAAWTGIILSALTVMVVNSGILMGSVTVTPQNPIPNSWVKLDCRFSLAEDHTTIVYWSDVNGDTLYHYEKDKNPQIEYGSKYTRNGESGLAKDAIVEPGHQSVMLFIRCNQSPYTCYIWNHTTELHKALNIELNGNPGPLIHVDGRKIRNLTVEQNSTHTFSCRIIDATNPHDLKITVIINQTNQTEPSVVQSIMDTRSCSYSSHVQQTHRLQAGHEVDATCTVKYESGPTHRTSIATCGGRPPQQRTDCGFGYITKQQCLEAGCCWDDSIKDVKWCFGYTAYTGPQLQSKCLSVASQGNCAPPQALQTREYCMNRGCCWDNANDPKCYYAVFPNATTAAPVTTTIAARFSSTLVTPSSTMTFPIWIIIIIVVAILLIGIIITGIIIVIRKRKGSTDTSRKTEPDENNRTSIISTNANENAYNETYVNNIITAAGEPDHEMYGTTFPTAD